MSPRNPRRASHTIVRMRFRFPELLKEHKVTPFKLATMTGIPKSTLYRLRRNAGRVSFASSHIVEAIAKALGVGIIDILELEGTQRQVRRKRSKS
jgi:DNA-binding Xre family transcriptional regulator